MALIPDPGKITFASQLGPATFKDDYYYGNAGRKVLPNPLKLKLLC